MPVVGLAAAGSATAVTVGATATTAGVTLFTTTSVLAATAFATVANALIATAVSAALSALATALTPQPRPPGIRTQTTTTGGTVPEAFVLGRYATAGALIAPPMSHGRGTGRPNVYLTYVVEVASAPGHDLAQVIVDGEPVTLGATPHADYGLPMEGRYANVGWVKYYDGTQTAADPMLVAKYGDYPDRPWSSDMVGAGICYAIVTFRFNSNIFTGFPSVRFVLDGLKVYDPRADSSVGGSGAQRWADPSTWARSSNPIVQVYNILRGIPLPGGETWGGDATADDLPLGAWVAAMNACDAPVSLAAGGTEPAYRAGLEVYVEDEPATVIEDLLRTCSGQIAEVGGRWTVRVGPPALPVFSFTDDDVVVTEPQDYEPFQSLAQTYNAVTATYPEPASLWEPREAPPRFNAQWEAEDGGRRLIADLNLNACPYAQQVQRLMVAYAADERRRRRHVLTLPPEASILEPLDAVSWTSARNGYTAKVFEVVETATDWTTGRVLVSLRERDADDYDWTTADEIAVTPAPGGWELPSAAGVPGFAVAAASVPDAAGTGRRPALRLTWEGDVDDATGIEWEVRVQATATVIARGSTHDVGAGELWVADAILPATAYEARARLVAPRETDWTAWAAATTGDLRIETPDLGDDAVTRPYSATGSAQDALTVSMARDGYILAGVSRYGSATATGPAVPTLTLTLKVDGVTVATVQQTAPAAPVGDVGEVAGTLVATGQRAVSAGDRVVRVEVSSGTWQNYSVWALGIFA